MTRQLDGCDLDSIPLHGMPIHNISLADDANSALLSGTITEMIGVAAEGAGVAGVRYLQHEITSSLLIDKFQFVRLNLECKDMMHPW